MSALYVQALANKARFLTVDSELRSLAELGSSVKAPSDEPNLISATAESEADLWLYVYNVSKNQGDLDRAVSALSRAVAIDVGIPDRALSLESQLANIWIRRLESSHDNNDYRRAWPYVDHVRHIYADLTDDQRTELSLDTKYTYYTAQMGLARFTGDADFITGMIAEIQSEGLGVRHEWDNPAHNEFVLMYSSLFSSAYGPTNNPQFLTEAIGMYRDFVANVEEGTEDSARAKYELGMTYLTSFACGVDAGAKANAVRSFEAAESSYRSIGDEPDAEIAATSATAMDTFEFGTGCRPHPPSGAMSRN